MTSFDAHQYAKRLIKAGTPPAQADVHADALGQVADEVAMIEKRAESQRCQAERFEQHIIAHVDKSLSEFREYVNRRFSEQDEKIAAMNIDLIQRIEAAKWDVIRWTFGIVLGVASLETGIVAALLHWMR